MSGVEPKQVELAEVVDFLRKPRKHRRLAG